MAKIKSIKLNFPFLTLLVAVAIFLFSCNQGNDKKEFQNEKGQLVVQEWYSVDKLKSETTYLNQELNDYVYIEYNENGRLIDSGRYVNDTITGFHKFFEDKTNLMHFEHYENGFLNGKHKAVYNGGATSFEGYRKDGFLVGEWKFHYPDGKMITYEYYDSTGRVKYFRKYDDEGKTVKIKGNGIISVAISNTLVDTSNGLVEVAIPDYCNIKLEISQNGNSVLEKQLTQKRVPFSFKPGEYGGGKLTFQLIITEEKTGKEEVYSLEKKY
ncbi:MAG: hypothetical protein DRJ05_09910 [Bacteroidetes bacterium]|nr:MAG: hypothetical protein DRJ05_09910 [Bacteroidota bacterium]